MSEQAIVLADVLREQGPRDDLAWQSFRDGVEICWIYEQVNGEGMSAAYLRYEPGAKVPRHRHTGYEHIFILEGSQSDDWGHYPAGTVLISPPGTDHAIESAEGCVVLAIWERPVEFL
jgi:anti-sigma factor ChrR (cupin superfamily)